MSTLKRRPSPSTSSLSSNSSTDRRAGSIQTAKFGTQSPDAVNKLLLLSDSSQTKSRTSQKSNANASPIIPSTGLTSRREENHQQQLAKMRETNKLTSESSSLNFKAPAVVYVRSHIRKRSLTIDKKMN